MDHQHTYGYKLNIAREGANLTQTALARKINDWAKKAVDDLQIEQTKKVTAATIKTWENNKDVPADPMVKLIAMIFADIQNLEPEAAKELEHAMLAAAAVTRNMINELPIEEGAYGFGEMITDQMQAARVSGVYLAKLIKQRRDGNFRGEAGPYDVDDIIRIEHGIQKPSRQFVRAATEICGAPDCNYDAAEMSPRQRISHFVNLYRPYIEQIDWFGPQKIKHMAAGGLGVAENNKLEGIVTKMIADGIMSDPGERDAIENSVFLAGDFAGKTMEWVLGRDMPGQSRSVA